ncbi:MAG TPA: SIS domain-containing protein [Azonexus sp.]|nr:SIS domain-containing protein [Azonexus sp.]
MGIALYLERLAELMRQLAASPSTEKIELAARLITQAFKAGRPLLVCGNGGSAADAQHIAGELVGRFLKERQALPCICLAADMAVMTALGNDYGYDQVFARQVEAYGVAGGILLGISTSGNSANVVAAFEKARSLGMTTIALTGAGGGALAALADVLIDVPSRHTPDIQQAHLALYHFLCERIEVLCLG